ncbi:magnesium chelatase [Candidatus Kuenenbacteria bacterium RIFCSPHIGHO2_02_FULL_39_13]|uniref:Magnesium chelatase n=1 Tax=Candidatus Kuenenbacteria bacterium RIFCSPHIGHO2_02_FULL_39_13 TaxID=1798561 RepID=A0A1F6FNG2_9BACT|nr:MAG: magnesium chelatase [Candidatus Kuenenbacteria bacterium RIFCSPHIGHO2_02_FULL_39_13]
MSSKILSAAVIGLDCQPVEVEADIMSGLARFNIVGLPDNTVQESKYRVKSAIKNSALALPRGTINVNLAPADLKKQGPSYDLPIALSILSAYKQFKFSDSYQTGVFIGELALDGHLRAVNGTLSVALMVSEQGIKRLFLPVENAAEAGLIEAIEIYPAENLSQVVKHLTGELLIEPYQPKEKVSLESENIYQFDMAHIRGQEQVKRALEIAAAGGHNILMSGPPGSGKTLLARTMPSILPEMFLDESLEVTKIYSVAGLLPGGQPLITIRPFRSPHHTASAVSLVGGGSWPRPGEISLAHHGVLFLDEFPEFPRAVLNNLRQPLEDGVIHISRASGTLEFPAKFILLAAMNPCPCGYYSDPYKNCICSQSQVLNYQNKISGPMLDRIDIHIEVPRVEVDKLASLKAGEPSVDVRVRVNAARARQIERFKTKKIFTNSQMSSEMVRKICELTSSSQELLKNAVSQLHLSARGYYRIIKLARTIADLAGEAQIKIEHVAEALQYRAKVE